MGRYVLRRENDGLVIAPAVMAEPDAAWITARQSKAAADFGGTWQFMEIDADTYQQIETKLVSGRAAYLLAGEVVSQEAPTLSADKTQIAADDTDAVTLSIQVGSPAYAGTARYRILTPEGNDISGFEPVVAGNAALVMTFEQVGSHRIRVDVLEYGYAEITVEGVE